MRQRAANQRLGFIHTRGMGRNSQSGERAVQIGRMNPALLEQFEPRHQIVRRALGDNLALAKQHQAVSAAQHLGLVLDHDQAESLLAQAANQRKDLGLALGVEVGGRLVEHDHRRAKREHRGDREPLLFAAGERGRIAMLEAGQADRLERGADAARHLGALHPDLLHRERDFVRDVGGKKLRLEILEDHPDLRRDFAHAHAIKRAAADSHHARKRAALELGNDPIEALGERRLARARRAHHADHLACGDRETDTVERRTLAVVIGEAHAFEHHVVRCAGRARSGTAVLHISPTPSTASTINGLTTIAIALSYGGWVIAADRNDGTQ